MEFNNYFKPEDLAEILTISTDYKHSYHLVVTFPNIANIGKYIIKLNDFLNNKSYHYYGWHCNTSKKFKKANNPHPRKKHIHLVLFTNIDLTEEQIKILGFNISFTPIYDLENILNYIHDGHHILHNNYYNNNFISSSIRDVLSNLRISDR